MTGTSSSVRYLAGALRAVPDLQRAVADNHLPITTPVCLQARELHSGRPYYEQRVSCVELVAGGAGRTWDMRGAVGNVHSGIGLLQITSMAEWAAPPAERKSCEH